MMFHIFQVPSLITVYEFTIKSVYTIEMILCHCNQQCGQVSDREKPDIFPYKANACRTEDKTSKKDMSFCRTSGNPISGTGSPG